MGKSRSCKDVTARHGTKKLSMRAQVHFVLDLSAGEWRIVIPGERLPEECDVRSFDRSVRGLLACATLVGPHNDDLPATFPAVDELWLYSTGENGRVLGSPLPVEGAWVLRRRDGLFPSFTLADLIAGPLDLTGSEYARRMWVRSGTQEGQYGDEHAEARTPRPRPRPTAAEQNLRKEERRQWRLREEERDAELEAKKRAEELERAAWRKAEAERLAAKEKEQKEAEARYAEARARHGMSPPGTPLLFGTEGVGALKPLPYPTEGGDVHHQAASALGAQGAIVESSEDPLQQVMRAATKAFAGSGVSEARLAKLVADELKAVQATFYDTAVPWEEEFRDRGVRQPGSYGNMAAHAVNNLMVIEVLKRVGEKIGVQPLPGYREMPWDRMSKDFEELVPAVSLKMEALHGIVATGGMRTAADLQARPVEGAPAPSSSPGRFHDIEGPKYDVDMGYGTAPVYGFLRHRAGSEAPDWAARANTRGLGHSPAAGSSVTDANAAGSYGDMQILFTPKVREKTTFSFGDSLVGSKASRHSGLSGGVGRPLSGATAADVALAGGWAAATTPYIEAQMWEAPKLEDIEEVIAPAAYHDEIRKLFASAGRTVKISEH